MREASEVIRELAIKTGVETKEELLLEELKICLETEDRAVVSAYQEVVGLRWNYQDQGSAIERANALIIEALSKSDEVLGRVEIHYRAFRDALRVYLERPEFAPELISDVLHGYDVQDIVRDNGKVTATLAEKVSRTHIEYRQRAKAVVREKAWNATLQNLVDKMFPLQG